MNIKTIIFNSELEFRNYIITNSKTISRIIVFEDSLSCVIFFYCFTNSKNIIASKETTKKNFSYYSKIYSLLGTELNYKILSSNNVIDLFR